MFGLTYTDVYVPFLAAAEGEVKGSQNPQCEYGHHSSFIHSVSQSVSHSFSHCISI